MQNTNQRFWQIAIGLLLVMLGIGALEATAFPMVLLLAIGGYLIWRQSRGRDARPLDDLRGTISDVFSQMNPSQEELNDDPPSQPSLEKVYAHALKAVERAGLDPDTVSVLPTDIGVIAFKGDDEQVVHRTLPVLNDIDYLQPYVQLRLPRKAVGKIKFEIIDADGQRLFVWEEQHQFQRGRNLITPAARLPIHDAQAMHNRWKLVVSADGVPLATHEFEWAESDSKRVRRHLTEDGEISNEMRASLADSRLGKMSLDELLAHQDADDGAASARR